MFYTIHRAIKLLMYCGVLLVCWKVYERREFFEPAWLWVQVWDNGGFKVQEPETIGGRVIHIVNSQTFIMTPKANSRLNVRLMGLREPGQEISVDSIERENERKKALAERIEGKWVHVKMLYENQNNIAGVVLVAGTNVNADLVLNRFANTRKDLVKGLPKEDQYSLLWALRHRIPAAK